MKRTIDPIGKKYGKLLVLEEFKEPIISIQKYRKSLLKLRCQCDCGNIVTPFKGNVLYGKTTQCIHCQNSHIDIDDKIGSLTVLERRLEGKRPKYLCKCDCGDENLYNSHFLANGKKVACDKCRFPKKYAPKLPKKTKKQALADINFAKHLRAKSSLIGMKNGRLKIIEFSHWEQKKTRRRAYYKAKCKCGNVIIVRDCFSIKSCGCLRKDSILKGEDQSVSILTNAQARSIREFKKANIGYTQRQLANMFGVSECLISRVLLGKSYKE
jgi:hypothetical protein